MLRFLRRGADVPEWLGRITFEGANTQPSAKIGCLTVCWKSAGMVYARSVFGGPMIVIDGGGGSVRYDGGDGVFFYGRPIVSLF